MQNTDVAIIGGGMVGLALACSLQRGSLQRGSLQGGGLQGGSLREGHLPGEYAQGKYLQSNGAPAGAVSAGGLRITVLEPHPPVALTASDAISLRVSAINAASETLLRHLGVWPSITGLRASEYRHMEVWEKDGFGRIQFSADQLTGRRAQRHLGYIIENELIRQALWQKAQQSNNITFITNAQIQQLARGENDAVLTLSNGTMLAARLLVAADGAHSWLRQQADIPLTFWDYQHHALVATIRCQQSHQATARQLFHGDGILAFLPLTDAHLCSIVWSLPPQTAEQMRSLAPPAFNQALCMAFDNRLGLCSLESERQVFPLTGRYARQFVGHRIALVGDAAHTIHPLAGQGVNLGLMDAAWLAGELRRLYHEGKDIGQHLWLKPYERRRKYSAVKMLAAMQTLRGLFSGDQPLKKLVRDVGLNLADKLPGVKAGFILQAMGQDDLPDWLTE